jgi:hypothetical protein
VARSSNTGIPAIGNFRGMWRSSGFADLDFCDGHRGWGVLATPPWIMALILWFTFIEKARKPRWLWQAAVAHPPVNTGPLLGGFENSIEPLKAADIRRRKITLIWARKERKEPEKRRAILVVSRNQKAPEKRSKRANFPAELLNFSVQILLFSTPICHPVQ